MREIIKNILEKSVYAPSGDNLQPWRFAISDTQTYIYNIPEKDLTLYNFRQRAAYISHGALIENLTIAASVQGYACDVNILPDPTDPDLVAIITLNPAAPKIEPLYEFITVRSTNRKPYTNKPLSSKQKEKLFAATHNLDGITMQLVEDLDQMQELANAISSVDRLIFENRIIHDFLFDHIRWTEDEEQKQKSGLFLKTMELKPPQVAAFKLFKHWNIMRIFNTIGFPKVAVKGNAKLYAQGAGIGVFLLQIPSNKNFVLTGRIMQRLWLTLTSLGLNLHPLTAVPFLMQRIVENEHAELSSKQITLVTNSYNIIKNVFKINTGIIGFMFRFGEADRPSGRSSRLPPMISDLK